MPTSNSTANLPRGDQVYIDICTNGPKQELTTKNAPNFEEIQEKDVFQAANDEYAKKHKSRTDENPIFIEGNETQHVFQKVELSNDSDGQDQKDGKFLKNLGIQQKNKDFTENGGLKMSSNIKS